MRVREGTSSDLQGLIEIDDRVAADPRRAGRLAAHLAHDACLVAEERGRVIAFVFWNRSFFDCGFVALIVVAAPHRRCGVGLRLLHEVEARCARARLFTSTNASNSAAQALFGRAGFVPSGIVENLDRGDPELVFFKAVAHDRP